MNNTLSIILSLVLLIGCENNGQALKELPKEVPKEPLKEVPETGFPKSITSVDLARSTDPGFCEGVEKPHQVINDEDSWQRLLSKMGSDCFPFTELGVDFSRFTVIAVFAGSGESACPPSGIIGICEYENSISVWVGKDSITQPYHIVKVPKTGKAVNFVERPEMVECGDWSNPFLTKLIDNAPNYYYYNGEKIHLTLDTPYTKRYGRLHFKRGGGAKPIGISDIFRIALKSSNDVELLRQLAAKKNASIERHLDFLSPLWYRLRVDSCSSVSSLQVCNELYETGHFADLDPAFIFDFSPKVPSPTK